MCLVFDRCNGCEWGQCGLVLIERVGVLIEWGLFDCGRLSAIPKGSFLPVGTKGTRQQRRRLRTKVQAAG